MSLCEERQVFYQREVPPSLKAADLPSPAKPADAERSLLHAIAEGEIDDHLGAVAAAVDARRRLLQTIDSSHMLATSSLRHGADARCIHAPGVNVGRQCWQGSAIWWVFSSASFGPGHRPRGSLRSHWLPHSLSVRHLS